MAAAAAEPMPERSEALQQSPPETPQARATGSRNMRATPNTSVAFGAASPTDFSGQRVQSAPLLPASRSTHANSWFCTSFASSDKTSKRPSWRPLGDSWRTWDTDPMSAGVFSRSSQLRSDCDNQKPFVQGTVPHWGKDSAIRMRGVLEHELTWAYYRMRRHANHPLRQEVGDPYLPQTDVVAQMRSGGNKFQFWRDLRPPFHVVEVRPIPAESPEERHPDGRLYAVTYLCGIEYAAERMWNEKSDGGTFDNKIQGVAKVRMCDQFPRSRQESHSGLTIVSWGRPCLGNVAPVDAEAEKVEGMIPPELWMPIADELGKRPDSPRFAACREATRRAIPRKGTQVPPLQKLLLGTHASLPLLVSCEAKRGARTCEDEERGVVPPGAKPKARQHRVFTPAAGFVKYSG